MIGVDVEGIPAVTRMLEQLESPQVLSAVTKDVATLLKGKLQKYPGYQYVSRVEAYGQTFKSVAQRKWFFAALRSGELKIPYPRTNKLTNAWQVMPFGGTDHLLVNDTPYAHWVHDGRQQSRMMILRQWYSIERTIYENTPQIQTTAQESINREVKRIAP